MRPCPVWMIAHTRRVHPGSNPGMAINAIVRIGGVVMSTCCICGSRVSADVKVCDHCLRGYWLGPKAAAQDVCARCAGTGEYVLAGRTHTCEFCS